MSSPITAYHRAAEAEGVAKAASPARLATSLPSPPDSRGSSNMIPLHTDAIDSAKEEEMEAGIVPRVSGEVLKAPIDLPLAEQDDDDVSVCGSSHATLGTSEASIFSRGRYLAARQHNGNDSDPVADDNGIFLPTCFYHKSALTDAGGTTSSGDRTGSLPPTPSLCYRMGTPPCTESPARRTVADVVLQTVAEYNHAKASGMDSAARNGNPTGPSRRTALRRPSNAAFLTLLPRLHGVNEALLLDRDTSVPTTDNNPNTFTGAAAAAVRESQESALGEPMCGLETASATTCSTPFSTVTSEAVRERMDRMAPLALPACRYNSTNSTDGRLLPGDEWRQSRLLLETACHVFSSAILQPVRLTLHGSSAGGTYMVTTTTTTTTATTTLDTNEEEQNRRGTAAVHSRSPCAGAKKSKSGASSQRSVPGSGETVIGVFKPRDEEIGQDCNPHGNVGSDRTEAFTPGTGSRREVLAYRLDHGGFAGVPPTIEVATHLHCPHDPRSSRPFLQRRRRNGENAGVGRAPAPVPPPLPSTTSRIGSLQFFVPGCVEAADVLPGQFDVDEVHALAIFDIRTLNGDRHGGNVLVKYQKQQRQSSPEGTRRRAMQKDCGGGGDDDDDDAAAAGATPLPLLPHLVPIDHSYICPSSYAEPEYEWLFWPQAKLPFTERSLNYIRSLDAEADAELVRLALQARSCAPVVVEEAEGGRSPTTHRELHFFREAAAAAIGERRNKSRTGHTGGTVPDDDGEELCRFGTALCLTAKHEELATTAKASGRRSNRSDGGDTNGGTVHTRAIDPSPTTTSTVVATTTAATTNAISSSGSSSVSKRSSQRAMGMSSVDVVFPLFSLSDGDGGTDEDGGEPESRRGTNGRGGTARFCDATLLASNNDAEGAEALEDAYVVASPLHPRCRHLGTASTDDSGCDSDADGEGGCEGRFPQLRAEPTTAGHAKRRQNQHLPRNLTIPVSAAHHPFKDRLDSSLSTEASDDDADTDVTNVPSHTKSIAFASASSPHDSESADSAADIMYCTTRLLQIASLEFGFTAKAIGELLRRPTLTCPSFFEEVMEEQRDLETWRVDKHGFEHEVRRRLAENDVISAAAMLEKESRLLR